MHYGVIDLGSNTIRLTVYEQNEEKVCRVFHRKSVAGLAGYINHGVLEAEGMAKICDVLNDFKETALGFLELPNLHLFATASLRNILNRDDAVRCIAEATTLTPDVIGGDEEASLSFLGASRFTDCDNGIMVDIGGASTELVLFSDYEAGEFISLPVGCLNLSVSHVSKVVPKKREWKRITAAVRAQFAQIPWRADGGCQLMVGVGGTLRAALRLSAAVYHLDQESIDIEPAYIKGIIKLLKKNKKNIYRMVYKTAPDRLMTLPTGLIILQEAIRAFGCKRISVSNFGIREGYLLDRVLMKNGEYSIDKTVGGI
ncbi:MAG: phosphatase [Clostridiales bacterium]|nr:phosphatase [Clostridiales bacterium]